MEKILISACLVGENCKYNGQNNFIKEVEKLYGLCDLILICPESFGGLPTPRQPSEINNKRVINQKGRDVTSQFKYGASLALHIAKMNDVKYAVLKENSPSCGVHHIYDGTFSGKLTNGKGITTQVLEDNGIKVFTEHEIDLLIELLKN